METTPSKPLLAYSVWLDYPKTTREQLAKLFNIKRTGDVVVNNSGIKDGMPVTQVTSDGYRPADLYAITVERMQELLGSKKTDFYKLLDAVIENIDALVDGTYNVTPPVPVMSPASNVDTLNAPVSPAAGIAPATTKKPPKKAVKNIAK